MADHVEPGARPDEPARPETSSTGAVTRLAPPAPGRAPAVAPLVIPEDPEAAARAVIEHVGGAVLQLDNKARRQQLADQRRLKADLDEQRRTVPPPPRGSDKPRRPTVAELVTTAADLDRMDFPPVRFVVGDLLPRGLTLLAAAPKIGKTWLDMGLADAVARGGLFAGKKPTDQGDVLLLDLEGNQRRAQKRMRAVRQGDAAPDGLCIAHSWPRMDQGGLDLIREWATAREPGRARLVIIDVWNRFRPPAPKGADAYQHDADTLAKLHRLAIDLDLAILVVHHTRKAADADFASEVNGSQGIAGTVDTLWIIRRQRGKADAVLHVTGREVEDQELALAFEGAKGAWSILGEAAEVLLGRNRDLVHSILVKSDRPMSPKAIAEETELSIDRVKKALRAMVEAGSVVCPSHGSYAARRPIGH